ncbi:F510_1955 family glycosylhydrolase [Pelomicrobium methylotrophicum]|uniref:Glycosyl hydrolase n=1 Tax=Pelomicrobium methylotrophicum TaxID=2602750 RepID=A0A5C7ELL3_9PROT|nr:glycosyl hydrolase [Pelomicrobium methylotrophicum]TXF12267.1 glycosyl hydrolase [Pelomicrobium methylotrophicum]
MLKRKRFGWPLPAALALAAVGFVSPLPGHAESGVTLTHVHGLAYSADGTRLYIPSHYGLAVYNEGHWTKAPGPQHDYMGFSATRDRFYSSGHPAPGTGLKNPFGLIRSDDGGKTWQHLGLEGESDFHVLATGYETNVIYVYNPHPNSRMREPGIYYTLDDGFAWRRAQAKGLGGDVIALAVHPSDPKTVAAATDQGIFLSRDAAATFEPLLRNRQGLAVYFDLDGKRLWAATFHGQPALTQIDLEARQKTPVTLPPLTRDAVAYIAQNPKHRDEYAIATFERNVYLTRDGGKTWTRIADRGRTL